MGENKADSAERAEVFADALAELKERGCMLLLAGRGDAARRGACRRLLGQSVAESRRRLFVLTGGADTHPHSQEPGATTVAYDTTVRSAAAAPAGETADRTVDGSLGDLHAAVAEGIDDIDRDAGGLGPGQLRLCLDSADSLLAEEDSATVFRFLHGLRGVVRDADAMCHVHLPVAFDAEDVQLLTPLFDAVIETRPDGRHRWHLREPELTTDWLGA
jgi:hypothetical protein